MIVKASSFADYADLIGYIKARDRGLNADEAFNYGDNGVGCWGDVTAQEHTPMFALPPEDWQSKVPGMMVTDDKFMTICGKYDQSKNMIRAHYGAAFIAPARGRKARVTYKGKTVIGELRDTMPHLRNIKNGARIDLNPAFAKAFGVSPPFMLEGVEWEWV